MPRGLMEEELVGICLVELDCKLIFIVFKVEVIGWPKFSAGLGWICSAGVTSLICPRRPLHCSIIERP